MTKLCPRGKAAAKRKFKVYPSAYANAYASKICAGKIKDPSGVKRKDFKGRKPAVMGGMMRPGLAEVKEKVDKLKNTLKAMRRDRAKVKKAGGGRIGYSDGASEKGVRQPNRNIPKGKRTMGPISANKRKPFKTIDKIIQEQTKSPKTDPERLYAERMKEFISPTERMDEDKAMKRESRLSTKIRGYNERVKRAGGGLMEATARLKRQGLKAGGKGCKLAMKGRGRAYGKNS